MWWALLLLQLHGPNGQVIDINPGEIVSIREPRAGEDHLPHGTHCIINTSDGKFSGVHEDCPTVERMIKDAK
jgi:hypothetical protein